MSGIRISQLLSELREKKKPDLTNHRLLFKITDPKDTEGFFGKQISAQKICETVSVMIGEVLEKLSPDGCLLLELFANVILIGGRTMQKGFDQQFVNRLQSDGVLKEGNAKVIILNSTQDRDTLACRAALAAAHCISIW
eukprot:TRINITY_DN15231_c0_g1_i1.p1 TRINITY_DN15231_c0_g1~~TRINITY_DN15231_c0_g1_i1.p1  ORF type:complete len:139 (+),score=12.95 TRINITY_DN15231_c0_g1_i1:86-502(+)